MNTSVATASNLDDEVAFPTGWHGFDTETRNSELPKQLGDQKKPRSQARHVSDAVRIGNAMFW